MTNKPNSVLYNNCRMTVREMISNARAAMPPQQWLEPHDPAILHRVYTSLDLDSLNSRRCYKEARAYCEDHFPLRHSWRAFPASGVAEFGFAAARDGVQFALWSPNVCYLSAGAAAALRR